MDTTLPRIAIIQVGIAPVSIMLSYIQIGRSEYYYRHPANNWMILVGGLDNVLKPIIMGKGACSHVSYFSWSHWRIIFLVSSDCLLAP
jgi:hypothetical protein